MSFFREASYVKTKNQHFYFIMTDAQLSTNDLKTLVKIQKPFLLAEILKLENLFQLRKLEGILIPQQWKGFRSLGEVTQRSR